MNWAAQPNPNGTSPSQYQIFVGGLAGDVDDKMLLDAFRPYMCTKARIIWDKFTRRTKGYGFVMFK